MVGRSKREAKGRRFEDNANDFAVNGWSSCSADCLSVLYPWTIIRKLEVSPSVTQEVPFLEDFSVHRQKQIYDNPNWGFGSHLFYFSLIFCDIRDQTQDSHIQLTHACQPVRTTALGKFVSVISRPVSHPLIHHSYSVGTRAEHGCPGVVGLSELEVEAQHTKNSC